jgi:hypothetical protein
VIFRTVSPSGEGVRVAQIKSFVDGRWINRSWGQSEDYGWEFLKGKREYCWACGGTWWNSSEVHREDCWLKEAMGKLEIWRIVHQAMLPGKRQWPKPAENYSPYISAEHRWWATRNWTSEQLDAVALANDLDPALRYRAELEEWCVNGVRTGWKVLRWSFEHNNFVVAKTFAFDDYINWERPEQERVGYNSTEELTFEAAGSYCDPINEGEEVDEL